MLRKYELIILIWPRALWSYRRHKHHCNNSRRNRASDREDWVGHLRFWDLDCPKVDFMEKATGYWKVLSLGLGDEKQCLLDSTET